MALWIPLTHEQTQRVRQTLERRAAQLLLELDEHDSYWAAKEKADGYSVFIKAYDRNHIDVWRRWSAMDEDAGQQLPLPRGPTVD